MAHTLLFPPRCVAQVTRRLFERAGGSSRLLILCTVLAVLVSGGCFTSPINRAPVISQLDAVGTPTRGQPATFVARGSDPDQDQLTWTWAVKPVNPVTPGRCPDPTVPGNWPTDTVSGQPDSPATFIVGGLALTSAPYCVWAFATDRYGAIAADNLPVVPADNLPVVTISVLQPVLGPPYPAYSTFQLSAVATDADQDPLTYDWKLNNTVPGSTAALAPCPGNSVADSDTLRCFTADLPGTYSVSLAVSDGMQTVNAIPVTLPVLDDAPPCIGATAPMYLPDGSSLPGVSGDLGDIVVNSVIDDGDPFPAQQTIDFFWYTSTNDEPLRYLDSINYWKLTLGDPGLKLGDIVKVRLEVKDRKPARVDQILAKCGPAADFCSTTPPAGLPVCYVRVSWRIMLSL